MMNVEFGKPKSCPIMLTTPALMSEENRVSKPGDRVGAILSAKGDTVNLIGYGVYVGDEVPTKEIVGFNFDYPTPKIELDKGGHVFGCECWWGPEDKIKANVSKYTNVNNVDMEKVRQGNKQA
jgi:hypothetical protein